MTIRMRAFSVVLCIAVVVSARAEDRTITWITMEFPPFFISDGPDQGRGIAESVTQVLQREMEGWRHATEIGGPAKILSKMKSGRNVCSAAYIKNPARERVMAFSMPDLVLPPNGITIRTEDLSRFGGAGPVRLADLLGDGDLKAAVARGRSYGAAIDDLLERHKGSPNVYHRLDTDVYRTLFDLLIAGSVDYVIGYPYEAHYFATQMGVEGKVTSLTLVENPEYTLAHVVCSKTEWGKGVIREIDAILREERVKPEYREFIERWLGDEIVEDFRRQYRGAFLEAAPPQE